MKEPPITITKHGRVVFEDRKIVEISGGFAATYPKAPDGAAPTRSARDRLVEEIGRRYLYLDPPNFPIRERTAILLVVAIGFLACAGMIWAAAWGARGALMATGRVPAALYGMTALVSIGWLIILLSFFRAAWKDYDRRS